MVFDSDLATLVIAFMSSFMAFTSTATAQKIGQVNIYNEIDCDAQSFSQAYTSITGSAENDCAFNCTILNPSPTANGFMLIFYPNPITTCYFFDAASASSFNCPAAGAGSNYIGLIRSDQGCQQIPTTQEGGKDDPNPQYGFVAMQCFTGEC